MYPVLSDSGQVFGDAVIARHLTPCDAYNVLQTTLAASYRGSDCFNEPRRYVAGDRVWSINLGA